MKYLFTYDLHRRNLTADEGQNLRTHLNQFLVEQNPDFPIDGWNEVDLQQVLDYLANHDLEIEIIEDYNHRQIRLAFEGLANLDDRLELEQCEIRSSFVIRTEMTFADFRALITTSIIDLLFEDADSHLIAIIPEE